MCGIIGSVNFKFAKDILDVIAHRGPDGSGWVSEKNVQLGHVRLSIQDVSENGSQPYHSANGNYIMVFNGEIYNHWQIRKDLSKPDSEYRSSSDTETILEGYIELGDKIFDRLNGIFALAIYDRIKNRLLVVRDRFGVKPLYYAQNGNEFQFCSELKALKPADEELNFKALSNYVRFLWSPGEDTPLKHVKKLLPGELLILDLGPELLITKKHIAVKRFNGERLNIEEDELIDKVDYLMVQAVKRQLLSDVPVGFFLSGGLDSSLIVAIARKLLPDEKIQCFTIDTTEFAKTEGFSNDLDYAQIVAKELNVDLEVVNAKPDILNDFDKMIWLLDEPQADPAPFNVLNISIKAKEMGYKVLVGGAGGDDVFSGYRRHQMIKYEKIIDNIPQKLLALLGSTSGMINPITSNKRRIIKLLKTLKKPKSDRLFTYFDWLDWDETKELFRPEVKADLDSLDGYKFFRNSLAHIPLEKDKLNQLLQLELTSFLVDHNLNYTDKMGMAAGVEIRVPFLDNDLVDFSYLIPTKYKLNNQTTKYILKKVAERYLPHEVIYRSKAGFGAPVRKWITQDLAPVIETRLSKQRLDEFQVFDSQKVIDLIEANKQGKIDASYSIWALLSIESWARQFLKHK